MKLEYKNATIDEKTYSYVPPQKVVYHSPDVKNAKCLLNKNHLQSFVHFDPKVCLISSKNSIILDFGRELHGQVLLTSAMMNKDFAKIKVTLGESVSESMGTPTKDHAIHQWILEIPRAGQVFVGNSAFRFVNIEVLEDSPCDLPLIGVSAVAIYRDWDYVGYFKSNDKRINKIWDVGAYTVHLNCQDYIYDGVKRDRLVWVGDLYPEIKTLMSVFEDSKLIQKSLDFIQETTPCEKWMNGISSYTCWYLICMHGLYLYRSDLTYLQNNSSYIYIMIEKLLKCISANNREKLPGFRFLDWSTADAENIKDAGLQGLMAYTLKTCSQLCLWLNNEDLASRCSHASQKLQSVNLDCYGNKVAAAMQILGGVGSRERLNSEIMQREPELGLSTFYGYFILEAKALANDYNGSLEVIRKYWGGMLNFGATTFWEDFDLTWTKNAYGIDSLPIIGKDDIHGDFGKHCYQGFRHSLCHGWAGGPTSFLSEHILGVAPLEPGFKKALIAPNLGDLKNIDGAIPTPYGVIEVSTKSIGNSVKTIINAPKEIEIIKVTS